MKAIYKYFLEITDRQTLTLPQYAQILTVQVQAGNPYLWALVDPNAPKAEYHFAIFGTGYPVSPDLALAYIATFQQYEGKLVFHVFEEFPELRGKQQ